MKRGLLALAVLVTLAGSGHAGPAKNFDDYKAALMTAQDQYRAAGDRCKPMKSNARDVCKVEAKADYEVTKAQLQDRYQPTPGHDKQVRVQKAEAAYRIAVEKCSDLKGDARKVCRRDAVTQYRSAMNASAAS
jgi:type II secretory pathway pseudopilin PulG